MALDPREQQRFGTAGVEGVKVRLTYRPGADIVSHLPSTMLVGCESTRSLFNRSPYSALVVLCSHSTTIITALTSIYRAQPRSPSDYCRTYLYSSVIFVNEN